MTDHQANAIYDILVSECGASEDERTHFVAAQAAQHVSEWRFRGFLGFGGKFWRDRNEWRVSCYPEDETPGRLEIIKRAAEKLAKLRNESEEINQRERP